MSSGDEEDDESTDAYGSDSDDDDCMPFLFIYIIQAFSPPPCSRRARSMAITSGL